MKHAHHDHDAHRAAPPEPGYPEHSEKGAGHADHSVDMFRDKFWWSLALTVPTLIWGELLQRQLGYTAPGFPGSDAIPAVFGTIVFVYGGRVFIQGAVRELKERLPGMMTLISLAISVAFLYSAAVTLG